MEISQDLPHWKERRHSQETATRYEFEIMAQLDLATLEMQDLARLLVEVR
jgi:hypothetical protein